MFIIETCLPIFYLQCTCSNIYQFIASLLLLLLIVAYWKISGKMLEFSKLCISVNLPKTLIPNVNIGDYFHIFCMVWLSR